MIEQFGLRRFASFSDALTMRWRNKKIVDKTFSTFTAGSKFWSITQVIGVIGQFGLRRYASLTDALTMIWRNKKNVDKKISIFTAGSKNNVIFVHNSGNRCDRTIRFAALCIVNRCAYDEMEK